MSYRAIVLLSVSALSWTPAAAQLLPEELQLEEHRRLAVEPPLALRATPSTCDAGGLVYDDGTFESGLRPVAFSFRGDLVQRFDLPAGLWRLERMCVCWRILPLDDSSVLYDLRVWAANGPNGGPGTLLGEVSSVSATSISTAGSFYGVNVSASAFEIEGPVSLYIGPSWLPGLEEAFVCTDESPTTTKRAAYFGTAPVGAPVAPSTLLGTSASSPDFRAAGIRAQFVEVEPPSCVPSSTAMCLTDGRFKVEVKWKDFAGMVGTGKAVDIGNPSSGIFYFFTPDNLELLIKVLNGCGLNSRYWVYFAATTDVEFEVTVTDTRAPGGPVVKKYSNPLGQPADAVTDGTAFATCP